MKNDRKEVGKIKVQKKALNIDELENKVKFAADAYKRAFDKYQRGVDSTKDWSMVIRALKIQSEEIRDLIAVAHHNIGVIYATNGQYAMAIESFTEALSCNSEYAIAHKNLGIVYQKMGDAVNARKHLEEAKRLGHKPKSKS